MPAGMRGLGLFVAAILLLAGGWAYVDRSYAVAIPASGGPFLRRAEGCTPPQPGEEAAMAFAGFHEGPAASTVRLASSRGQEAETSVVDVRIAAGTGPIYLLMTSGTPVVVRLSGWTRRLERVVLLADGDVPMGVVGAPADIVTFASRHDCRVLAEHFYHPDQYQARFELAGIVRRPRRPETPAMLRYRMPDALGGAYEPRLLTISGSGVGATSYEANERDPGLAEWEEIASRFMPAGVTEIDPGQVISNARAAPYRVLPGWAGLAQLVREGKIRLRGSEHYQVLAQIDIPVGLAGAQAVTFEVMPRIPWPRGDPGHSIVRRAAGF
ncbi:MAG: hypothetical protein QOG13_184 [Sphingomonadales bacterium]|jgi:hypothetical protein|nr:hypothetical protein [Sphingomonadales bacterium]